MDPIIVPMEFLKKHFKLISELEKITREMGEAGDAEGLKNFMGVFTILLQQAVSILGPEMGVKDIGKWN